MWTKMLEKALARVCELLRRKPKAVSSSIEDALREKMIMALRDYYYVLTRNKTNHNLDNFFRAVIADVERAHKRLDDLEKKLTSRLHIASQN